MKKYGFLKVFLFITLVFVPCLGAMYDPMIIDNFTFINETMAFEDIQNAIEDGDLEEVKQIIATYKDTPEKLVNLGKTPLHLAIKNNQKKIFDYLMQETVFGTWRWVNQATIAGDKFDETPLLACVKKHNFTVDDCDVIHQLLLRGANINARDKCNGGTSLWNVTVTQRSGENLALAQLLVWSGANIWKMCKNKHTDRGYNRSRGCRPSERAKESKYPSIEGFLLAREMLNFSLIRQLENEQNSTIQDNLYARALFYEKYYNTLSDVMALIKKIKQFATIQDVENDAIKKLIKSQCFNRLCMALNQGFYCTDEDFKNIQTLLKTYYKNDPNNCTKISKVLRLMRENKQTYCLQSFACQGQLSDLICYCTNEPITVFSPYQPNKKRTLKRVLSRAKIVKTDD